MQITFRVDTVRAEMYSILKNLTQRNFNSNT